MIDEVSMIMEMLKEGIEKKLNYFKSELSTIKAGRANPNILNKITIDYYGSATPLNQVANISVPEARLLVISPWDVSMIKEINKAIQASDIGLTPNDDGKVIRLVFPILTEERRRDLVKQIKKQAEECKVQVRNERRDALTEAKKLEKEKVIAEDDLGTIEKDVQKIVDASINKIEELTADKEKEIMTV